MAFKRHGLCVGRPENRSLFTTATRKSIKNEQCFGQTVPEHHGIKLKEKDVLILLAFLFSLLLHRKGIDVSDRSPRIQHNVLRFSVVVVKKLKVPLIPWHFEGAIPILCPSLKRRVHLVRYCLASFEERNQGVRESGVP